MVGVVEEIEAVDEVVGVEIDGERVVVAVDASRNTMEAMEAAEEIQMAIQMAMSTTRCT
jgi:hypothetical protein